MRLVIADVWRFCSFSVCQKQTDKKTTTATAQHQLFADTDSWCQLWKTHLLTCDVFLSSSYSWLLWQSDRCQKITRRTPSLPLILIKKIPSTDNEDETEEGKATGREEEEEAFPFQSFSNDDDWRTMQLFVHHFRKWKDDYRYQR